MDFTKEIAEFLVENSITFSEIAFICDSDAGLQHSINGFYIKEKGLTIIPVPLSLFVEKTDWRLHDMRHRDITHLNIAHSNIVHLTDSEVISSTTKRDSQNKLLYIYEDRWRTDKSHVQWKILGSVGLAKSVFARKCKVLSNFANGAENRISKDKVEEFLSKHHSYGFVKNPYCVALSYNGSIVAAATFSAPKRFIMRADRERDHLKSRCAPDGENISESDEEQMVTYSYEWTRYASLPEIRVSGGMGKVLEHFIKFCLKEHESEVHTAVQIMSYSDIESGDGSAYKKLGFKEVSIKAPISYFVDKVNFKRLSVREYSLLRDRSGFDNFKYIEIKNLGSKKFVKEYIDKKRQIF